MRTRIQILSGAKVFALVLASFLGGIHGWAQGSGGKGHSGNPTVIIPPDPAGAYIDAPVTGSSFPTGTAIAFSGSTDSGTTFSWNFGDGSAAATGATVGHTYTVAGTYSVTLTVSATGFTTSHATISLTITACSTCPVITAQPASKTVLAGATATFSVTATGAAPLAYQWRKNGTAITGATAASYTTPATTAADNGALFSVVVSNASGTATSTNAVLTINSPPAITTQPKNASALVGGTASFSVTATGTATLTYQWRKNGTAITGATAASYTTPAIVATDDGATFSVVVTNAYGTVTSGNAIFTLLRPPTITTQPLSQTVLAPQTATFSVAASGTAPFTYQWRKAGVNISGATAATYTTPATTYASNGAAFSVVVTNAYGSATSANAVLTVNSAPMITTQPAAKTVNLGQTAIFTVVATGPGTFTYQWRKNGTAIMGATAASYTTPAAVAADNGALFSVVITNTYGSTTSANAALNVNLPPTITSQPKSIGVNLGQTATFTVAASGTSPFTYQWKKGGVNISGATAASYTTPVTTATDDGAVFSVVVTNAFGTASSANATLSVCTMVTITTQPLTTGVVVGQTATFMVVATGKAPITYQWMRNSTAIAGATTASYTTPATVATDEGAVFSVVVANGCSSVPSANAKLTVLQALKWTGDKVYAFGQLVSEERPLPAGGTQVLYDHVDQVGTPNLVSDTSTPPVVVGRARNLPFGERFGQTGVQAGERFAGHENGTGSGIYMQDRAQLPSYGVFAQADRMHDQESGNPLTWNLQSYARNNPSIHFDPKGKDDWFFNKNGDLVNRTSDKHNIKIYVENGGGSVAMGPRKFDAVDTQFFKTYLAAVMGEIQENSKDDRPPAEHVGHAILNAIDFFDRERDKDWYGGKLKKQDRIDAIARKPGSFKLATRQLAKGDDGIEALRTGDMEDIFKGAVAALSPMDEDDTNGAYFWVANTLLDRQKKKLENHQKLGTGYSFARKEEDGDIERTTRDDQHTFFKYPSEEE